MSVTPILGGGSVTVTVEGADGAILDGASAAIKATVLDLTNANPLTVAITDANGDQVTSFGGGTQYTEDAAAAANPVGTMLIARRKDTLSALEVSADGDNIALNATAKGELHTAVADGSDVALGALADAAAGDASGSVNAHLRFTAKVLADVWDQANNRLTVNVEDSALPTGAASAANQTTMIGHLDGVEGLLGTIDADTGALAAAVKAEDAAHASGDSGVMLLAVRRDADTTLADTTGDYAPLQVDANGRLKVEAFSGETLPVSGTVTATGPLTDTELRATAVPVSLASVPSHAVTNAGTFAVQAASAGDVAHDAADSGNPLKVGAKAVSAEPAAVAANDRANLISDLVGKLITLPYANPENFVSGAITSAMTGTTSTSLVAAPGAGLRNYITTIIVSNAHATVGTDVILQDGSGGTTLMTIPAAAVYGGAAINLPVPLRQPTTNTALFCANVTTGASTKVSAVGYKGA